MTTPDISTVELVPTDRFEWERLVRRISPASMPFELKGYAVLLGTWADPDGSRVRPGEPRLANITGKDKRTIRRWTAALRKLGLLAVARRGGGRGGRGTTTEYQLTIPVDLLDRLEMLDPDDNPTPVSRDIQVSSQSASTPVSSPDWEDTQVASQSLPAAVDNPEPAPIERTPDDTSPRLRGHLEPIERTPGCPTTRPIHQPPTTPTHYWLTSTVTPPTREDSPPIEPEIHPPVVVAATAAPQPEPQERIEEIEGPAAEPPALADTVAEAPTPALRPAKCARHGLSGALQDDGSPRCQLCRRELGHQITLPPDRHLRAV